MSGREELSVEETSVGVIVESCSYEESISVYTAKYKVSIPKTHGTELNYTAILNMIKKNNYIPSLPDDSSVVSSPEPS